MVKCQQLFLSSMRNSWAQMTRPGNSQTSSLMDAVHHKILDMGCLIETKFKLDNIHITGRITTICVIIYIIDVYLRILVHVRLEGIQKITGAVSKHVEINRK